MMFHYNINIKNDSKLVHLYCTPCAQCCIKSVSTAVNKSSVFFTCGQQSTSQTVHLRSLISGFVIHSLKNIMDFESLVETPETGSGVLCHIKKHGQ